MHVRRIYVHMVFHRGCAGNDVFLGDIVDIYAPQYQDEDVLHYDKRLYFNSLSIAKATEHGMTLYKRVDNATLQTAFVDTPHRPIGFDEEMITCHLMLDSEVSARWYNAECPYKSFWFYQGRMFDNNAKKCLMHHFGGGSRGRARRVKQEVMNGLRPYFQKGYNQNTSIGFGLLGNLYVYFTVRPDASIDVFEHWTDQGNATSVLSTRERKRISQNFQTAYVQLYPPTTDTATADAAAAGSSKDKPNLKIKINKGKQKSTVVQLASSARAGNATDFTVLAKKCRGYAKKMANIKMKKEKKEAAERLSDYS